VHAESHDRRQQDRQEPADEAELERLAADGAELQLVAGKEHEHAQAELGQRLETLPGTDEVEHLRSEDDAERDLEDHRRHGEPAQGADDQRCQDRRRRDEGELRGDRKHQEPSREGPWAAAVLDVTQVMAVAQVTV